MITKIKVLISLLLKHVCCTVLNMRIKHSFKNSKRSRSHYMPLFCWRCVEGIGSYFGYTNIFWDFLREGSEIVQNRDFSNDVNIAKYVELFHVCSFPVSELYNALQAGWTVDARTFVSYKTSALFFNVYSEFWKSSWKCSGTTKLIACCPSNFFEAATLDTMQQCRVWPLPVAPNVILEFAF